MNQNRSARAVPGGNPWVALLFFVAITSLAAAMGSAAAGDSPIFYATLVKPVWAPPSFVFGPVWTVLYVLMAVAAWLVWRAAGPQAAKVPLALYLAQLALNALWTWLFFRWRLGGWAFLEIFILWLLLLCTVLSFWRIRMAAGILLLPYWTWVSFAMALNAVIWRSNPDLL